MTEIPEHIRHRVESDDRYLASRAKLREVQARQVCALGDEGAGHIDHVCGVTAMAFRQQWNQLREIHVSERRLADPHQAGPVERAKFLLENMKRLSHYKLLHIRDVPALAASPARFAKTLRQLHQAEGRDLAIVQKKFQKRMVGEATLHYQLRYRDLCETHEGERTRLFDNFVKMLSAPEIQQLRAPAAEHSQPPHERGHAASSVQPLGRAEQIRADMQNWLIDKPEREHDKGREL